jgi:tRNA threonylcarbamoyladenosine biosynthesis protein TsaB
MVTLALDTSTRTGSCAVLRDDVVLAEIPGDATRSHAERLPADLITALALAQLGLAAVDTFAVAIGPGSFTGLRVGIATMQGLALPAGAPLVGLSVLDALALSANDAASEATREPAAGLSAPAASRVATWVDAWRGEVYAALYEDGRMVEAASVERPDAILARLAGRHGPRTLFIGDGAAARGEAIRDAMGAFGALAPVAEPLLAGIIGRMAARLVREGHRPAPDEIHPLYVRRPDVELVREARVER